MPYRLKGILKLPNSAQVAAGVDIEFISRRNYSPLLMDLSSVIKTSPTGAYDITLEYGEYAVVLYWGCNQPSHIGKLFVFADTTEGLDLQTLLQQADWQPATPEYVQQIQGWLAEGLANATKAEQSAAKAKASEVVSKLEADRSKIEADKAAQAVIDSSVPFPDVWIPLSDSLRMLSGYGRDIKVGDDTVASLASFERATTATYIDKTGVLRTSAIDEPRFERCGLLVEGQSTNLISNSEDWPFYSHVTGGATSKVSSMSNPFGVDDNVKSAMANKNNVNVSLAGNITSLPLGSEAFSLFFKISNASKGFYIYTSSGASDRLIINQNGEIVDGTAESFKASVVRLSGGWFRVCGSFASGSNRLSVNLSDAGDEIAFWGIQAETLPYTSSYIATRGSAVTRSADKISIPKSNNQCSEFYSGASAITVTVINDTIQINPESGKLHLRNVKGFFAPLTDAQKKGLK